MAQIFKIVITTINSTKFITGSFDQLFNHFYNHILNGESIDSMGAFDLDLSPTTIKELVTLLNQASWNLSCIDPNQPRFQI